MEVDVPLIVLDLVEEHVLDAEDHVHLIVLEGALEMVVAHAEPVEHVAHAIRTHVTHVSNAITHQTMDQDAK